jgi:integrase
VLPHPDTEEAARIHPVSFYMASLAPGSRPAQLNRLRRSAALLSGGQHNAWTFPWHLLTVVEMNALRSELAERRHHGTGNNYLSAIRSVLKCCRRLGLMSAEAFQAATDFDPIRGKSDDRAGRHVGKDELATLFTHLENLETASAARDLAALAILRGTGMRRAELLALEMRDYDPADGTLRIRHGKGNRARTAFLPWKMRARLERWFDAYRGRGAGYIVCLVDKWGGVRVGRPMATTTFHEAMAARVRDAGIRHFSAHDLRRTMVGDLLEAGIDISRVMQAGGWNSPEMAQRYDRRGDAGRRETAAVLDM